MRDFKNYKKHVEVDMVKYSGTFHFNQQLKQEGSSIKINEQENQLINNVLIPIKAIVRNTGVENKEGNEERSIIIGKEYDYKAGDYVEYLGDTYITTTCIDKDNPFFNTAKMKRCNYNLKWMDNGQLYQTMVIITNQTKYTLGTDAQSSAGIIEGDSRFQIILPNNVKTKTLVVGKRFIFNDCAWKTTQTDRISEEGLLSILTGQDSINDEIDDRINEIADIKVVKHDYKFDYIKSFSVTKDDTYKLVYSFTDNGKDIDSSLVTVENSSNLIQVIKNDKDISIKGLSVGTGSIKLKVNLIDGVREFVINYEVKNEVVNQVNYEVKSSNGYTYRPKEGATVSGYKYINGTPDGTLVIDYSLDTNGTNLLSKGNITIVKKSNTELQIRNVNISTPMSFTLTITDKTNGTVILTQVITLKGV